MRRIWITLLAFTFAVAAWAGDISLPDAWDKSWRGDPKGAIETYQKFARENPDDPSAPAALFNAASLSFEKAGDPAGAQKDFLTLVEKYPKSKYALQSYRLLAQIAAQQNRPTDAADYYRRGLLAAQNADFQMPDAWYSDMVDGWRGHLTGGDDPAQAAKMYQEMLAYIPPGEEAAETYFSLAQALKSPGQNQKAAGAFSTLMLSYPFSRWTARTLREEREFVSQAVKFPWEDVEKMSQIQRLSRAGAYQQVRDIAAEMAPKHPNDPLGENAEYAMITSDVYLTSDFDGAIEQMQGYLDKYPKALRARDARRRIEIWREISGLLDDLAENPQDYPTHQQVGFTLLQSGFYNQAAEHFETVKTGSGAEDAYLGLGYTYMRLNRTAESIENFERYLKNHPDDGTIYNLIGYAYMGSGELAKAEECFARYKDLEPTNPNSHDSYAECLMNSGKLDEAIAEYKEAIKINPSFTNAYAMLGQIYIMKGETQSAQEFFSKYLELDPSGVQSAQARAQLDSLGQK